MPRVFSITALLFVAASAVPIVSARAEESSAWSKAFPERERSSVLGKLATGAGQVGLGILDTNLAIGGALGLKVFEKKAEPVSPAMPAEPAPHVPATNFAYEELLQKHARLQKFLVGESMGALSAAEKIELAELRSFVEHSPYTLEAARQMEADARKLSQQRLLAESEQAAFDDAAKAPRFSAKRAVAYRFLSAAALVFAVSDGGLRILTMLQGRNPGYSPAVNLSREMIKGATGPTKALPEREARSSMSAE